MWGTFYLQTEGDNLRRRWDRRLASSQPTAEDSHVAGQAVYRISARLAPVLRSLSPAAEIRAVRGVADSVSSANITSDPLHTRVPVNNWRPPAAGKTAVRRAKGLL